MSTIYCKYCDKDITNCSMNVDYWQSTSETEPAQIVGTACYRCYISNSYRDYISTGEITTRLLTQAVLGYTTLLEYSKDPQRAINMWQREYLETTLEFKDQINRIYMSNMRIENQVTHLMMNKMDFFYSEEKRLPHGCGIANMGSFEILIGGSAGRIMVTLHKKASNENKHRGAYISIIFPDTPYSQEFIEKYENPATFHMWQTAGIQGICATEEEAISLLDAALLCPEFVPEPTFIG